MEDSKAKVVITADEGLRAKKVIKLKAVVDKALEGEDCACVTTVLVYKRTGVRLFIPPSHHTTPPHRTAPV